MNKLKAFLKKEPVLCIAAAFAAASMLFVPPNAEYLGYIDFKTLACLFCLMASVKGMERGRALKYISLAIAGRLKTLRALAFFLVFACFFFAMFVTNDVSLIAIIPIAFTILSVCGMESWSAFLVVLMTIAANIGSSLTPIGNPQNLYLFTRYEIPLGEFLWTLFPIVAAGAVLLALSCLFIPNLTLRKAETQLGEPLKKQGLIFYAVLFILSVMAVFGLLPYWAATAAVFFAVLMFDRKTLFAVDYSLLLTFIVIFLFVGNLARIEPIHAFLSRITEKNTLLTSILTSQATSNVPAAILLSGFTDHAKELLAGVNIGGLGTLIASMASVISYKMYASVHKGQTGRYILLFSLWNLAFLILLTALGFLLFY
ncbi:MAG TPA: SLC13 family permease [Clostridia bacterium]|nr:SLC13 family permease [Clostridia bacterium]